MNQTPDQSPNLPAHQQRPAANPTSTMTVDEELSYELFKYDKNEWDNVPQVIPRFTFHLEKNVKNLTDVCADLTSRETTKELRRDMESKFSQAQDRANAMRQTDLDEKGKIKETTDGLNEKIESNAEALSEWQEKLKEYDREKCLEEFKLHMEDPIKLEANEVPEPREEDVFQRTIRENAQEDYRLFNFLQFFDLTMYIIKSSQVPVDIKQNQEDINDIYETLAKHADEDEQIREYVDSQAGKLNDRIGDQEATHQKFAKDNKVAMDRVNERLRLLEEGVDNVNRELRFHNQFLKQLDFGQQQTGNQLSNFQEDTKVNFAKQTEEFQELMDEEQTVRKEAVEELTGLVDQVRTMARDQVAIKEQKL